MLELLKSDPRMSFLLKWLQKACQDL